MPSRSTQAYAPVDSSLAPYARTVLKRLVQYQGQYWITGQQEIHWDARRKDEMSNAVYDRTSPRQYPGLRGWDTPFGGQDAKAAQWMIDTIISDWRAAQVLPTISNHWSPISPHGYKEMFNYVSIDNMFTDATWERTAYLTWRRNMADDLQKLAAAEVPVLWRPYHEGGGGWFWWDRDGVIQYRRLWHDLYDYLVHTRGLHNLIWVWTRGVSDQSTDWYPGDERVDIIGGDIYNESSGDYRSLYNDLGRFSSTKLRALTECDYVMSPDLLSAAPFAYFMVWHSEHLYKNSDGLIRTVYNHPRSITRARVSQYLSGRLPPLPARSDPAG